MMMKLKPSTGHCLRHSARLKYHLAGHHGKFLRRTNTVGVLYNATGFRPRIYRRTLPLQVLQPARFSAVPLRIVQADVLPRPSDRVSPRMPFARCLDCHPPCRSFQNYDLDLVTSAADPYHGHPVLESTMQDIYQHAYLCGRALPHLQSIILPQAPP